MQIATQSQWQKDDEVNKCPFCTKSFTLFFRKHHCRFCGIVVCENCSKTQLKANDGNLYRACAKCVEKSKAPSQSPNLQQNLPPSLLPSMQTHKNQSKPQ